MTSPESKTNFPHRNKVNNGDFNKNKQISSVYLRASVGVRVCVFMCISACMRVCINVRGVCTGICVCLSVCVSMCGLGWVISRLLVAANRAVNSLAKGNKEETSSVTHETHFSSQEND